MCNYDAEPAEVWATTKPRARKEYRCVCCGGPIRKGEVHLRVNSMYEGYWDTLRVHITCDTITQYIAFKVCGDSVYMLGEQSLLENVREHLYVAPELVGMYEAYLAEHGGAPL